MTHPQPVEAEAVARAEGHCNDDAAWEEFRRQYAGKPRSRPDMTDFELANAVFMADRNSFNMMSLQTAAKERIRWLSLRLASAEARALKAEALLVEAVKGFKAIRKIKAEPLAGGEFQTGPLSHFLAAQRIASQTLSTIRACKEGEG